MIIHFMGVLLLMFFQVVFHRVFCSHYDNVFLVLYVYTFTIYNQKKNPPTNKKSKLTPERTHVISLMTTSHSKLVLELRVLCRLHSTRNQIRILRTVQPFSTKNIFLLSYARTGNIGENYRKKDYD